MDKAPGVLIASQRVQRSVPAPRLRLLIEWEVGHRVFFGNLADLLLSRRVPQFPTTSRPARFWNDVFVPSGAPWSSFVESMLLHLLLIVLFVWGQSKVWVSVKLFPQRDEFHRSITYYPPKRSFRAAEGRASVVRARSPVKHASLHQPSHQPAIPVRPEQKPSLVTPPDIKQATAQLPNLPNSHAVTPMEPFSATADARRNATVTPSGVVAPPPQVDQATARQLRPPQASAVAPAPQLDGRSAGRAVKAPNSAGSTVVPPPPSVQDAGESSRVGRLNSVAGAEPNVVPPPPAVHGAGNVARVGSMAGAGSQVVPPPPSVQGVGNSSAGRLSSLSGAGPNVVPPSPAVQSAGNANARMGSMARAGSQVVPPPPLVQGSNGPAGGARLGPLSGAGPVPPPPSLQSSNGPAGGARLGALSGAGPEVVPPPPTVENGANSGARGRLGSLSGNGPADSSQVLPPPSSVEGAANSGAGKAGKALEPMDPLPAGAASGITGGNNENEIAVEDLPLGLIGVVFAAPGTSFFSNFEVFVAKRRIAKDQMQLIKLVYEFLPYQRRLSEYNLNNLTPRVIKLRVTPDPSCDESLGQMLQSETDPTRLATEYAKLPAALRASDLTATLPCYRTNAGDFQKAMSRGQ
jgi:hypothetical protein